jgi:hypothetical protein
MLLSVQARLCLLPDCELSGSVVSVHWYGLTCSYSVKLSDQKLSTNVADEGMLRWTWLLFFDILRCISFSETQHGLCPSPYESKEMFLVMPVRKVSCRSLDQQMFPSEMQYNGPCPHNRHPDSNTRPSGTKLMTLYSEAERKVYSCRLSDSNS